MSNPPANDTNKTEMKLLFRTPLDLRWSDLDAFNHVNNARYLTFLEESRIRWFDSIGEPWMTDEFYPVVVQAALNYRLPITYPSEVAVELYAERVGNTSGTIAHRIVSADGKTLYCDGNVVVVWLNAKTHRPRALPEQIRRAVG